MRITAMLVSFALLAAGSVAMLAAPAAHATAVWTFTETACFESTSITTPCPTAPTGSDFDSGPLPAAIGQFTVSNGAQSGTYPIRGGGPTSGDAFLLNWGRLIDLVPCSMPSVCQGTLSFAANGRPGSVDFENGLTDLNFHLSGEGGMIGSDTTIPGCGQFAECIITGSWALTSAPEPSSLTCLGTLLVVFFVIANARRRE